MDTRDGEMVYCVVINHEDQYSTWPADRGAPAGWRAEGTTGSRSACMDHIRQVWTDMCPLSLRTQQDAARG